jgi:hypothetical protein
MRLVVLGGGESGVVRHLKEKRMYLCLIWKIKEKYKEVLIIMA